ncbi:MAG: ATP-binding cassette domain-containing protein [Candidatus Eremiobacteraeota bacterium]|nr:ATP-binding cassette domain-containing protein [Candidatus Eremiobacteraeota bacterium]
MIELKNVSKTFQEGTANEVRALVNISLTVHQGDFVTVIGTNGSGKSTLLGAIAGGFRPDEGSIVIAGSDVTDLADYRRASFISRCFQDPFTGTAASMTVAENLHMAFMRGAPRGFSIGLSAKRLRYYREALGELEMQLEERLHTVVGTLSGGQRQALTLLMAVIVRPKVLLLDEHTAALDPKSAFQVLRLTQRFVERDSLTALMVTHHMDQAIELGNRTIMMHDGRIIEDFAGKERAHLTSGDLHERFAGLRKREKLTPEMREYFHGEYR